jgi:dephospho-CoA kinase
MRRIALTGGIATGKSTVAARLRARAVRVVDADRLARDAVAPGSRGLAAVVARFGPGILDAAGALDRAALARIVFADAGARAALEAIVHPRVRDGISAFFEPPPPAAPGVAEIPLVYETGWFHSFDLVIVVACRRATQHARLMARDGLSEAEADARLAAQWPIEDKARLADRVVLTDGAPDATTAQADRLADWLFASW